MNKRGSIIDILVWAVIAIVTIFMLGALVYMFTTVGNELSDIGMVGNMNMTNITAQTFGQVNEGIVIWLPRIALIILVTSALSILIHNFLVKAHPVFFVTYFFIVIAAVIASAYISNEYNSMLTNTVLGSTFQTFTGANFIMAWLPYWVTVIGFFGAIFLFIGIIRDRSGGVTV